MVAEEEDKKMENRKLRGGSILHSYSFRWSLRFYVFVGRGSSSGGLDIFTGFYCCEWQNAKQEEKQKRGSGCGGKGCILLKMLLKRSKKVNREPNDNFECNFKS